MNVTHNEQKPYRIALKQSIKSIHFCLRWNFLTVAINICVKMKVQVWFVKTGSWMVVHLCVCPVLEKKNHNKRAYDGPEKYISEMSGKWNV